MIKELNDMRDRIVKLIVSDPADRLATYKKHAIRPIQGKAGIFWQTESTKGAQVFHANRSWEELMDFWQEEILPNYRQIVIRLEDQTVTYLRGKEKWRRKVTQEGGTRTLSHDRQKGYLLKEGMRIPALVDLGIFSKDYHIVKSMHSKFRQINRFVELIDDAFSEYPEGKPLRILDFGCGKSYLTFIVYYYFTQMRGIPVEVAGYDLKEDVVTRCNELSQRYGYEKLKFFLSDVSRDASILREADMVITLHACDTATDYALHHAIRYGARYVFSVPCCQHEVNQTIHAKPGDAFELLLAHGLIKERFSALLTDAIRAECLRQCGYAVDVIEFVDFEHSPKNLMLRALKRPGNPSPDYRAIEALKGEYGFEQTLYALLTGGGEKL